MRLKWNWSLELKVEYFRRSRRLNKFWLLKVESRIKLYQIKLIGINFKFNKTVIGLKSYSRVCRCSSQVYSIRFVKIGLLLLDALGFFTQLVEMLTVFQDIEAPIPELNNKFWESIYVYIDIQNKLTLSMLAFKMTVLFLWGQSKDKNLCRSHGCNFLQKSVNSCLVILDKLL